MNETEIRDLQQRLMRMGYAPEPAEADLQEQVRRAADQLRSDLQMRLNRTYMRLP